MSGVPVVDGGEVTAGGDESIIGVSFLSGEPCVGSRVGPASRSEPIPASRDLRPVAALHHGLGVVVGATKVDQQLIDRLAHRGHVLAGVAPGIR